MAAPCAIACETGQVFCLRARLPRSGHMAPFGYEQELPEGPAFYLSIFPING